MQEAESGAEDWARERAGLEQQLRAERRFQQDEAAERETEREEAELRLAELRAALRSREVTTPPFIQVSRQRN